MRNTQFYPWRLKHKRPYDHQLLVVHYLYQVPKRQMAKQRKKSEKQIRIEMQLAEGFVEGCLSMLDIQLEMDLWLRRENNEKKSNAVRI